MCLQRFHAILDLRNEVANIQAQISVLFSLPHPLLAGHTPGSIRQPPPVAQGPGFPLAARSEQPQRMVTIADHGYFSGMPGQSTHETSRYFEMPMTGAVPFEEGERADESEDSLDLDLDSEESDEENQEQKRPEKTRKDQFETSPEPRSLHSSVSESYLKRAKMPLSRVRALQRHRIRNTEGFHFSNLEGADHETQGTFTSAAPTPDSQQRVLLRPLITGEEEANDGEEEANDGEEEANDGEEEVKDGEEEANDGEEEANDGEEEANDGEEEANDGEEEVKDGEEEHEEQGDLKSQTSQELRRSCELHQRGDEEEYSQNSISRTETNRNSNGDANEDIESGRGAGELSALTTNHQATLSLGNSSSHDFDTGSRRESGGSVAEDGDQRETPLLTSQPNTAEQVEGEESPSLLESDATKR